MGLTSSQLCRQRRASDTAGTLGPRLPPILTDDLRVEGAQFFHPLRFVHHWYRTVGRADVRPQLAPVMGSTRSTSVAVVMPMLKIRPA